MLGRHREYFNRKVCDATHADYVEWLDFPSGEKRPNKQGKILWDQEWQQPGILAASRPVQRRVAGTLAHAPARS
jgi:hypothetical protein